jgi:HSP20 family protein
MSTSLPQLILQGIAAMEGKGVPDDGSLELISDTISRYMRTNSANPNNASWKPSYDISDLEDTLVICLDVPGVSEESINIDIDDHFLDISGERHPPFPEGSTCRGVLYGTFEQRIKLPIGVGDPKSATVALNNGVLRISIDKTLEVRKKFRLRVKTNDSLSGTDE